MKSIFTWLLCGVAALLLVVLWLGSRNDRGDTGHSKLDPAIEQESVDLEVQEQANLTEPRKDTSETEQRAVLQPEAVQANREPFEVRIQLQTRGSGTPLVGVGVGLEGKVERHQWLSDARGQVRFQVENPGSYRLFTLSGGGASGTAEMQVELNPESAREMLVLEIPSFPDQVRLRVMQFGTNLQLEQARFYRVPSTSVAVGMHGMAVEDQLEMLPSDRGLLEMDVPFYQKPLLIRLEAAGYLPMEVLIAEERGEVQVGMHPETHTTVRLQQFQSDRGPAQLYWSYSLPRTVLAGDSAATTDGLKIHFGAPDRVKTKRRGQSRLDSSGITNLPFGHPTSGGPVRFEIGLEDSQGTRYRIGSFEAQNLGNPPWKFSDPRP